MSEKANKRRIPETLRRRALVSCDRCKLRRARCFRPEGQEACSSCLKSGTRCESTLPRKQRVYSSVESLSVRYRTLDALVRGLFPTENDTESLFRIAESRGIPMPDVDDLSPAAKDVFDQPTEAGSSPQSYLSPLHSREQLEVIAPSALRENPFASQPSKLAEEKLIPTPHGVSHYVGHSSSFRFAAAVRSLVAQCASARDGRDPRREARALQAFVDLKTSKALEPRLSGNVGESGDGEILHSSSEELTPDKRRSKPSSTRRKDPGDQRAAKRKQKSIVDSLPARSVADALLKAFFDHVHSNYALFHRGIFQSRYEAIWDMRKDAATDPELGWLCSLYMVFVLGAQVLEQHDSEQALSIQKHYLSLVRVRFQRLVSTTSLSNVQTLLLLQLYEHNAGERNTAWMLLGCASRMAVALGMHREGTGNGFDPIERNTRRRVWWTLYMFEQNLCVMLGRPSAIDDSEVYLSLPDETMLDGGDCPPDYPQHAMRLTRMSSRMKSMIYPPPTLKEEEEALPSSETARQLLQELDSWYRRLPEHLQPEWHSMMPRQRRAVLMLHVYYHHMRSLVTRPFLVRKVQLDIGRIVQKEQPAQTVPSDLQAMSQSCCKSAQKAISHLQQLATQGLFDGMSWLDPYYVYHGVLVLCLDFLARPRDIPDSAENSTRKSAVAAILEVVRRTKLAPTFQILAQVATQFAGIVGALEDPAFRDDRPIQAGNQARPEEPRAMTEVAQDSNMQGDVSGLISDWFNAEAIEFPWDFFDMGLYSDTGTSVYDLATPFAGTFGEDPAEVGDMNDWATHTSR